MPKPLPEYVRAIMVDTSPDSMGDGWTMNVRIVTCKADGSDIENPSYSSFHDRAPHPSVTEAALDDLEMRCYVRKISGDPDDSYGWHAEYRSPYTVNLTMAKLYVKTLTAIEKALEKAIEEAGYARTFGEYVTRVAKPLGITGILTVQDKRNSSYQAWSGVRLRNIGQARNMIDEQITALRHPPLPPLEEVTLTVLPTSV